MACSNCYNGCPEIISDKCVKYTGIDIPVLGIQNGDSLSYVEQALIEFLTSTLDGTGIKPDINPDIICSVVLQYLPECGDITATDLFVALIKATCDIQDVVVGITVDLEHLNSTYIGDCIDLGGNPSDTHAVLQAVIYALCGVKVDLEALAIDVDTNYVKLADLDTLIQEYLDSQGTSTKQYKKMVPYTVVEYYGSLANFDISGAGIGDWEQIYLCNGNNGTPDKRGRSPIGAIVGVGGGALSPVVDPVNGNYNYALGNTNGVNSVILSPSQMPTHTHIASVSINDPGHFHFTYNNDAVGNGTPSPTSTTYVARQLSGVGDLSYFASATSTPATIGKTSTDTTGLNGSNVTVTNANAGSSAPHTNVHPVLACYYIMYIPN